MTTTPPAAPNPEPTPAAAASVTPPPAAPVTPPPAAPAAPAYAAAPGPAPVSDGKTLGIVGLILAFVFALAGIIVSAIARRQSKRAGVKNTPATVGLILSIVFFVIQVIWVIVAIAGFASLLAACAGLEPGVYQLEGGGTLTCG